MEKKQIIISNNIKGLIFHIYPCMSVCYVCMHLDGRFLSEKEIVCEERLLQERIKEACLEMEKYLM